MDDVPGETAIPSGTVTFLFTDIERSTESAAALGDQRWAEALETHRSLLRPCFSAHGGVEVGTEGDSFFVAFTRANSALEAAVEGQRALETHPWSGETRLRVRIGMHTGEALVRNDNYVGHDVHKAKRVSDAGHGGQILLSETTADLIGKASLLDLGPHRLKDLGEPQRLYQAIAEGIPHGFPPLRSLESFAHNLPLQRSAFVGRDKEIVELRSLLSEHRLVTITGVGGCGKTRLALQVGAEELERFAGGVFFVDLAPLSDPAVITRTVAAALGISLGGIGEAPQSTIEAQLFDHLRDRDCLLVFDNCEHMLDDCAELVDRILARCPRTAILATSREALDVEDEQSWRIPSLSVPADASNAADSEAVSLFKTRAQAVEPSFDLTPDNIEAVAEICRRLDGIPLAIEFAAARVSHLSPAQIADRLGDMFNLLTGGRRRVQRQQTLQAALDWSYELLEPHEQLLLRRVAVFSGGFTLPAAEGICADDGLPERSIVDVVGSLVSKSLIAVDRAGDDVRYRMLETVRLYAEDKLRESGEADAMRSRHRDWHLAWVDSVPRHRAFFDTGTLKAFESEIGNLRAAFGWCVAEKRIDLLGHLAGRLGSLWGNTGHYEEGHRWLSIAVENLDQLDPGDRTECLGALSFCSLLMVDGHSLDHARRAADEPQTTPSPGLASALTLLGLNLSVVAEATGSAEAAAEARMWSDKAIQIARSGLAPEFESWILYYRGLTELDLGDIAAAISFLNESMRIAATAEYGGTIGALRGGHLSVAYHLAGETSAALDVARAAIAERRSRPSAHRDDTTALLFSPAGQDLGHVATAVGVAGAGLFEEARAEIDKHLKNVIDSTLPLVANEALIVSAVVEYLAGDVPRASRLLAAGRHAGGAISIAGAPFRSPASWALYRHYLPLIRAALDPEEVRRYRDEGRAMSIEQALGYALESAEPQAT